MVTRVDFLVGAAALLFACRQIAGIDDKTECQSDADCVPADVCGNVCVANRCTAAPSGRACADGQGHCNGVGACFGPHVQLAAMNDHTCARMEDGAVFCWGANEYGQLGDGTTQSAYGPVRVAGLPPAASVATGYAHSCAVDASGDVYCWGNNDGLQCGTGGLPYGPPIVVPTKVAGVSGVAKLSLGEGMSCAVTTAGAVYCWGANLVGQCGVGADDAVILPPRIVVPSGVVLLSVVKDHGCVVKSDGSLACWGDNKDGAVGDGTIEIRRSPVAVDVGGTVKSLGLSFASACVTREDATVLCWGKNDLGPLGDGTLDNHSRPAPAIRGLLDGGLEPMNNSLGVVSTSASLGCSLNGDTQLLECWGTFVDGQLGKALPLNHSDGKGHMVHQSLVSELTELGAPTVFGDPHGCTIQKQQIVCFGDAGLTGSGDPSAHPSGAIRTPTPVAWGYRP